MVHPDNLYTIDFSTLEIKSVPFTIRSVVSLRMGINGIWFLITSRLKHFFTKKKKKNVGISSVFISFYVPICFWKWKTNTAVIDVYHACGVLSNLTKHKFGYIYLWDRKLEWATEDAKPTNKTCNELVFALGPFFSFISFDSIFPSFFFSVWMKLPLLQVMKFSIESMHIE